MGALLSITLFVAIGVAFVLMNLLAGAFVRPRLPHPQKDAIYECGEVTIGSSWVQFNLRFYVLALFFLVFDVEIALIYPWAVIYRQFPLEALLLGLPFLGVVIIGYVYEWYCGSLDWIFETGSSSIEASQPRSNSGTLAQLARRDPETVADNAD